jgi:glycosyltransferase involved in cell wall biosynthesis
VSSCVAVIPARRAESTIGRTLESLRLGNSSFVSRVLVVTSACDPTAEVVRGWSARDERVELVAGESPMTAGAARNLGRTRAGNTRLLLFVDADCALEAGGAARLAAELERRGAAAIGARILGEGGWAARARHILEFKEAASLREPPAEWLPPSTTLLCRADAVDRAGGFPDLWPGEDLVFTKRLRDLGQAVVRSRMVSSRHRHPSGWIEMLRHQHRLGRTAAIARRMASMHGERFARSRALALLLLPGRTFRIARWQIGEGGRAALAALVLSPLLLAGLAAWTAGFVSASGGGLSADARSREDRAWRQSGRAGLRSARAESPL